MCVKDYAQTFDMNLTTPPDLTPQTTITTDLMSSKLQYIFKGMEIKLEIKHNSYAVTCAIDTVEIQPIYHLFDHDASLR